MKGTADVEFDFIVNGVRKSYKDHQPIVENTMFVPRSPDDKRITSINNPELLRRLKDSRILNEDGSINMDTMSRLDAYKRRWGNVSLFENITTEP